MYIAVNCSELLLHIKKCVLKDDFQMYCAYSRVCFLFCFMYDVTEINVYILQLIIEVNFKFHVNWYNYEFHFVSFSLISLDEIILQL